MGKADDKGEPVKTVTIGGKKVEVPIIFVLPEEAGEKEIERYEHPKVHVESKKGEKAESEEKPLDKLTHGKLEEVEKLPFPVPREETRDEKIEATRMNEDRAVAEGKVRPPQDIHLINTKDPFMKKAEANKGYSDEVKEGGFSQQQAPKKKKKKEPLLSNSWEALRQEWEDILPDESKKGFGKAQALARWYEQNKPKKEKEYLTDEEGDEIEKGVINNQPQIPDQTDKILAELKRKKKPKEKSWEVWLDKISPKEIEYPSHNTHRGSGWHTGDEYSCPTCARKREKKPEYDEEKAEATVSDANKSWEKWLENKSLGALGWGKLNRDGTKQKLRKRQPKLDDFTDDDGDKKDET